MTPLLLAAALAVTTPSVQAPRPGESWIAMGLVGTLVGTLSFAWGMAEVAHELGGGVGAAAGCVFGCAESPPVDEASPFAAPAMIGGGLLVTGGLVAIVYGIATRAEDPGPTAILVSPSPRGVSVSMRF